MKYSDELTSKKKNKRGTSKLDSVLSLLRFHYPLILAILSFIGMLQCMSLISNMEIAGDSAILFPLLTVIKSVGIVLSCVVIPFLFLFVIWMVIRRERPHNYRIVSILSDLVALGLSAFIAFVICFFCLIIVAEADQEKDKIVLNDQIFSLVGRNTYDDLGYGRFALYRCDSRGFSCAEIYETNWGYNTIQPAELAYDSEAKKVSVIIDGKELYTYQLE